MKTGATKTKDRVAVVIPAYNEAANIGAVLETLAHLSSVHDVIVVSDGSTDETAAIARRYGADVVECPVNQGKAAAMRLGWERARDADVVLFLDADLVGLAPEHVEALLAPVLAGDTDATVGVFEGGRMATELAHALAPFLSGQRAVRRSLLERLELDDDVGYGVEMALNRALKRMGATVKEVALPDVSQVLKEEKLGLAKGLAARMRMYWEILREIPRG